MPFLEADRGLREPQSKYIIEPSWTVYRHPGKDGRAADIAAAGKLPHKDISYIAIIDADEIEANPKLRTSDKVFDPFCQAISDLPGKPTINEALELLEPILKDTQASSTLGIICKSLDDEQEFLVTASTGSQPDLVCIDNITAEITKPHTPTIDDKGIRYAVLPIKANTTYTLLGSGITQTFDSAMLQQLAHYHIPEIQKKDQTLDIKKLTELVATNAYHAMGTRKDMGQQPFLNDVTIASLTIKPRLPNRSTLQIHIPDTTPSNLFEQAQERVRGFMRELSLKNSMENLQNIFMAMPRSQQREMMTALITLNKTQEGHKSIMLLSSLLASNDTMDIKRSFDTHQIERAEMGRLINRREIWEMINVMLDKPDEFSPAIATILAEIPLADIPRHLVDKIRPVASKYDFDISPWHEDWFLCDMFGKRMERSIKSTAVVFVNGEAVKLLGRMSFLCSETRTDNVGEETFMRGVIYSPTDKNQREIIKSAFDEGIPEIEIPDFRIAEMRSLVRGDKVGRDLIIKKIGLLKNNLPHKFPPKIGQLTRKAYREKNRE